MKQDDTAYHPLARDGDWKALLHEFDLSPFRLPVADRAEEIRGQMVQGGEVLSFTRLGRDLGLYVQLISPTTHTTLSSHRHEFLELAFLLSGRATHTVDHVTFPVGAGDILFQNHLRPHHFHVAQGEHPLILNLLFLPEVLQETMSLEKIAGGIHLFLVEPFMRGTDAGEFRLQLKGGDFKRAATLGLLMVDSFYSSFPISSAVTRHLFEAFLHLVIGAEATPGGRGTRNRRLALFQQILSEVDDRITSQTTLSDLARALGYGSTHLATTFKLHQGESIFQYIHRRRIEMATRALRASDDDIRTIALDVGFQDVSHFNRVFKSFCGVPPGQYRKNERSSKVN